MPQSELFNEIAKLSNLMKWIFFKTWFVNTPPGIQSGIEPTSVLCFGKM
jgi:hypothetical protein